VEDAFFKRSFKPKKKKDEVYLKKKGQDRPFKKKTLNAFKKRKKKRESKVKLKKEKRKKKKGRCAAHLRPKTGCCM
jgi:hypothetical protein